MAKVIAAADHQKYVNAVVTYLAEIKALPQTAPEVETEFQQGNFIVKRSCGNFNGIWTDMALECSQNCDAKGKTGQAGLKGITLKIQTQEKWFLTLPFAAGVTSAVKTMLHMDEVETHHHEDNRATVSRETEQRKVIIETVNVGMINPFTYSDTKALVNIAGGLKANKEITDDLLQLNEKGENALRIYVETGKLTKLNLKTMANTMKSHIAEKTKSTRSDLADEIQILKRALMLRNRHEEGKNQLEELLSHEMRKYPPSLAEESIQTKETMLRTGNKSSMLGIMKEKADLDDWPTEIDEGEITSSVVIDVMWYIRSRPP